MSPQPHKHNDIPFFNRSLLVIHHTSFRMSKGPLKMGFKAAVFPYENDKIIF